jgi:hypothetical protein
MRQIREDLNQKLGTKGKLAQDRGVAQALEEVDTIKGSMKIHSRETETTPILRQEKGMTQGHLQDLMEVSQDLATGHKGELDTHQVVRLKTDMEHMEVSKEAKGTRPVAHQEMKTVYTVEHQEMAMGHIQVNKKAKGTRLVDHQEMDTDHTEGTKVELDYHQLGHLGTDMDRMEVSMEAKGTRQVAHQEMDTVYMVCQQGTSKGHMEVKQEVKGTRLALHQEMDADLTLGNKAELDIHQVDQLGTVMDHMKVSRKATDIRQVGQQ